MKQLYRGKASLLYRATCRASRTPVALKLYRKHKLSNLNWYQARARFLMYWHGMFDGTVDIHSAFWLRVYAVVDFLEPAPAPDRLVRASDASQL